MFNEEKTSIIKKLYFKIRTDFIYHVSFKKKFSFLKTRPMVWGIWNVIIYGPNISMGKIVVIVGANGFRTNLTSVKYGNQEGHISVGDHVLIMNGVRISSANRITIGNGCMLANFCYIMDADWHDLHDRTNTPGKNAPVVLKDGAWIGDSAIICKGVTIGENSVVGAGSVVRKDVPDNVIVAGNPAQVVGKIDPDKVKTMAHLYDSMMGDA